MPRKKGYKQNLVDVSKFENVSEEVIDNATKGLKPPNLKYTPQVAISLFSQALHIVRTEDIYSISQLAVRQGVYEDLYLQLLKRFRNTANELESEESEKTAETLGYIKKQIDAIIVSKLVKGGIENGSGKNPIFTMFLLKCKHNYVEKQSIDISNSDGSMALPRLGNDEIKRIADKIKENI